MAWVLVLILVFMVGSAIVKFTMVSRLLEEIYYVKRQITCETFLACWKNCETFLACWKNCETFLACWKNFTM
jgi:hypothetical protein